MKIKLTETKKNEGNNSVLSNEYTCNDVKDLNINLKNKNGILVFHTNIRSIQNNIPHLQVII